MKKIIMILAVSLFCASTYAQQRGGQTHRRTTTTTRRPSSRIVLQKKNHAFFAGVKAGLDITSMTQPDECDLYDGTGTGFSAGAMARVRFNRASRNSQAGTGLLGAGIELKYKNNKVKTIGTNENGKANSELGISYFEVPVFVQLFPFYQTDNLNTLYIEAGPDFAGTLGRNQKSLTVDNLTGNYSSVTYHIDDNVSTLKGMDVRIMAGLGYDFPIKNKDGEANSHFGVNARYYFGTSKLAGNFNSKMNTLELSLSWMFNIGNL